MNSRPPRLRLVVAVLLCALCASPLVAQSAGTGALAGVVTDPTGAVIPNVVVTATVCRDTYTPSQASRIICS